MDPAAASWARLDGETARIRFLVNGKPLVGGGRSGDWQRTLDASSFPKGTVKLTAEAYAGSKYVCSKSIRVIIGRIIS